MPRPGQREQDVQKTWPVGVARASEKEAPVCLGKELSCEPDHWRVKKLDMPLDPHFLLLALFLCVWKRQEVRWYLFSCLRLALLTKALQTSSATCLFVISYLMGLKVQPVFYAQDTDLIVPHASFTLKTPSCLLPGCRHSSIRRVLEHLCFVWSSMNVMGSHIKKWLWLGNDTDLLHMEWEFKKVQILNKLQRFNHLCMS